MTGDDRLFALAEAVCDRQPIDLDSVLAATPPADRRALSLLVAISEQLWTPEPDDELAPLSRWGRFELRAQLGRGAFGEVYRAWDPHFEREVAVKLRHANLDSEATHGLLLAEGRLLAKIDHPGVARVYELGEHDGRFGLVMERVEGETLAAAIARRGPFPASEVAAFGVELAGALAALHDANIVHRDLKAQNVILRPDGRLVLVDFGIGLDLSKPTDEELVVSGTPLYMAPELFEGARPTPASDLYSLGVLLFHLATGEFPIEAETVADLRAEHLRAVPLAAQRRLRRRHGLVRVIELCLAPRPKARPAGAGQVAKRLAPWTPQGVRAKAWRAVGMLALLFGGAGLAHPAVLIQVAHLQVAVPVLVSQEAAEKRWDKSGGDLRTAGKRVQALRATEPLRDSADPFRRANYFAVRRQYEQARKAFESVPPDHERFSDAQRQQVHMAANLGDPRTAIRRAWSLFEQDPTVVNLELLAMYLGQNGEFSAALDLLSSKAVVLRAEGEAAAFLEWPRGIAHLGLGDPLAARTAFERLARGAQDATLQQAGAYYAAVTTSFVGDVEEARRLLERSLSAQQVSHFRDREALFAARLALERGDPADFSHRLGETLRLDPLPVALPEFRAAARLATQVQDHSALTILKAKIEAIDAHYPSGLSEAAKNQVAALEASLLGQHDQARNLLRTAQRGWWQDIELLSTSLLLADRRKDPLAACRDMKTLVTDRKGEILWTGIAYEWKLLADRYAKDCDPAGSWTRRE